MTSTTIPRPTPDSLLRPAFVPATDPAGEPGHEPGHDAGRGPWRGPVDGPVLPLAPREIARSLAGRAALWRPLVRFAEPRFYTRIATGPDWEAWLLTWLPGQSTALHDHGGSSGAFAVLAGQLDEALPLRTGGAQGRTHLLTRRYRAGQVRCFGSDHVHDVAARSGRRAVTLHVYTPRLTTMTRYALVDGDLEVTARERVGEDW